LAACRVAKELLHQLIVAFVQRCLLCQDARVRSAAAAEAAPRDDSHTHAHTQWSRTWRALVGVLDSRIGAVREQEPHHICVAVACRPPQRRPLVLVLPLHHLLHVCNVC
jgi:hypothetical protein